MLKVLNGVNLHGRMVTSRDSTIRIPYSHLAPGVKELIGHGFQGNLWSLANRFLGIDRMPEFVARRNAGYRGREGLVKYHADQPLDNTYSIRSARMSRFFAELHAAHTVSRILAEPNPLSISVFGFEGTSRIEAARLVQVLHEELAKQMHHSGIVNPHFFKQYPADLLNVKLLARTHPIFTVGSGGSITFRRPTRIEYARYKFQSARGGKLGVQPWAWRGYLEPPKAPEPWKKWATAKVSEWAGRLRPAPMPSPAFAPVRAVHSGKRTLTPRRRYRK